MDSIKSTIISVVFVAGGITLIVGTYRRWPWLIDPPLELWPLYSQSAIKKLFGVRAVIGFTYACGFFILLVGIFAFVRTVVR
jgi:hypothetical protein